jgi:hypothetical protein
MTWRLDPPTFGLTGGIGPTTLAEFTEQQWPACPVCGTTIEVTAICVGDHSLPPEQWAYIMGQWHCPRGCDPKRRTPEELGDYTGFGEPFSFAVPEVVFNTYWLRGRD